jgi:hypothetical protein
MAQWHAALVSGWGHFRRTGCSRHTARFGTTATRLTSDPQLRYSRGVPYRIHMVCPSPAALEILVRLGALAVESVSDGLAAILPDTVTHDTLARTLGVAGVTVSPAVGRPSKTLLQRPLMGGYGTSF